MELIALSNFPGCGGVVAASQLRFRRWTAEYELANSNGNCAVRWKTGGMEKSERRAENVWVCGPSKLQRWACTVQQFTCFINSPSFRLVLRVAVFLASSFFLLPTGFLISYAFPLLPCHPFTGFVLTTLPFHFSFPSLP